MMAQQSAEHVESPAVEFRSAYQRRGIHMSAAPGNSGVYARLECGWLPLLCRGYSAFPRVLEPSLIFNKSLATLCL